MIQVIVKSMNQYDEVEWEQKITSKTMRGAKGKATKWIQNTLFTSDYAKIDKIQHSPTYAVWYLL